MIGGLDHGETLTDVVGANRVAVLRGLVSDRDGIRRPRPTN
jgi:hypothetical protein